MHHKFSIPDGPRSASDAHPRNLCGYPLPLLNHFALVLDQGHTKARRWDIPWGNDVRKKNHEDGGGDTDAKLTRTLKVLPDAAANVEESDCFRVMR